MFSFAHVSQADMQCAMIDALSAQPETLVEIFKSKCKNESFFTGESAISMVASKTIEKLNDILKNYPELMVELYMGQDLSKLSSYKIESINKTLEEHPYLLNRLYFQKDDSGNAAIDYMPEKKRKKACKMLDELMLKYGIKYTEIK